MYCKTVVLIEFFSLQTVRKLLTSAVTEPVNADFGFSQSIVLPEEQTTAHGMLYHD
jgi:hypothetical protein